RGRVVPLPAGSRRRQRIPDPKPDAILSPGRPASRGFFCCLETEDSTMFRRWSLALSPLLPALLLVSCQRSDPKPLSAVKGRGVFKGQPVHQALVVFHPVGDYTGAAVRPHAIVSKDGTFTLSTENTEDGAPPGKYGVTVEWWLTATSRLNSDGEEARPI